VEISPCVDSNSLNGKPCERSSVFHIYVNVYPRVPWLIGDHVSDGQEEQEMDWFGEDLPLKSGLKLSLEIGIHIPSGKLT